MAMACYEPAYQLNIPELLPYTAFVRFRETRCHADIPTDRTSKHRVYTSV